MKILSHNFTGKSLTVIFNDGKRVQSRTVEQTHINWKQILALYKKGEYEKLVPLLDVVNRFTQLGEGKLVIKDGKGYFNGNEVNDYLFQRMIEFFKEFPNQYKRLVRFAENLYNNPSERARKELYPFLNHGNMPITDDGCFLAYKGVDGDYWSKTAGSAVPIRGKTRPANGSPSLTQIYNGVGEVIELAPNDVCADSSQTCAYGLHVGSFRYANDFRGTGRLMIVKVNPKDVITVPYADAEKLRCSRYEVIAEEGKPLDEKKNMNFDKQAAVRYHSKRDTLGRFVSA